MRHFYNETFLAAIIYSIGATIFGMRVRTIRRNYLWPTRPYYLIGLQKASFNQPVFVSLKTTHPPEGRLRNPAGVFRKY
ncbi:MAG: hypothetical protein AB7V36_03980 [Bacteroidales bacterium]